PVELWKQMIAIGPSPDTALAIPFSVPDGDDRWMKVSLAVNSLLDRTRLCEMLEDVDLGSFEEFGDMELFIDSEIEKLLQIFDSAEDASADEEAAQPRNLPRLTKPRRQRASDARDPLRR